MANERDEIIQHYRRMRAAFHAAIDGLDDATLVERSIDGWSVKDHMLHLAFWDGLRAEDMDRISAGYDTAWKLEGRDDDLNAIVYDMRKDLELAQARWEFDTSHRAVLQAIERLTPRGFDPSLYGEMGLQGQHEAVHTRWIERWRSDRED